MYRSPRALRVFQSFGWSSTTRTYSAMASSSLPCLSSFSAFLSASSRSVAKRALDPIKQGGGPERSPMRVGIAEPRHRIEMLARRVAFVPIESVAGIPAVELEHGAIAGHLRHDRRGGNRRTPRVAVHHTALRHRDVGNAECCAAID